MTIVSALFRLYQYGKVLDDLLFSLLTRFFTLKGKNSGFLACPIIGTALNPTTAIYFPGNNFCKYSINGPRSNYSLN
jgi:hypothetical protein